MGLAELIHSTCMVARDGARSELAGILRGLLGPLHSYHAASAVSVISRYAKAISFDYYSYAPEAHRAFQTTPACEGGTTQALC